MLPSNVGEHKETRNKQQPQESGCQWKVVMQVLILGRWRKDQIWAQKLEMSTKRFEGTPSSSVVWEQVKNSVCNGWSLHRPKNILRHQINNWILPCVRASSWTIFFNYNFFFSFCGRQSPNQKDWFTKKMKK